LLDEKLFVKNAVEKTAYNAPEAVVDDKKNHKCEYKYPKQVQYYVQQFEGQPQTQKACDKNHERIFQKLIHKITSNIVEFWQYRLAIVPEQRQR
jgi:hypothetical protein